MRESSRQEDGKTLVLRVSVAGRLSIEADGVAIGEERFPGRQGRLVFAYLVAESQRPVPREELAEALWGEHPPATWEKALTVIVSKLRGVLDECGLDGTAMLTSAFGCYRLNLPEGSTVDVQVAAHEVEHAASALASGDSHKAKKRAERAVSLARLPFLPGEDGPWVEQKRREQADVLVRGLGCLAEASLRDGDAAGAARYAQEETTLEPYREDGYRRLMQAHALAGNRAEALRVYERCRSFLADELGAYPSPETQAIHRQLLEAPAAAPVATPTQEPEPALPHPSPRSRNRRPVRTAAALAIAGLIAALIAVAAVRAMNGETIQALDLDRCSPLSYEGRGKPDLLIAADLPLQRGVLALTRPMAEAITLELERHDYRAGRFKVGLQVCDDATPEEFVFSPVRCAANARAYVENRNVIGVVGPFSSACASLEIRALNAAAGGPVPIVSPSNTLVGLTRRTPQTARGEPSVYYPTGRRNYARVVAADDVQGAADAILARELGLERVYVLDDTYSYGAAVASAFIRTAHKLRIPVVAHESFDLSAARYTRLAERIARSGADGVFIGGSSNENGIALLNDLRGRLGSRVQIMAPDGFDPDETATAGGKAVEGMTMSRPGVPLDRLGPAGREFVASFSSKEGSRPTGYAVHAAQAADVLLDAIARSDGTRASVTRNLFTTKITNGILGSFWITASGDTTLNAVTIYRIEGGKAVTYDMINVPEELAT
jgi:branched-chain amino acid transport system substrate-binding protein